MRLKNINANDIADSTVIEIRYRLLGSSVAYTVETKLGSDLPYTTADTLEPGQYEVGIRKKCGNVWSNWKDGQSPSCIAPTKFTAIRNGNNFDISYTLGTGQTMFEVEITDPNNGKSVSRITGPADGDTSIAISPLIQGTYSLRLRGICSATPTPAWSSDWTPAVSVDVNIVIEFESLVLNKSVSRNITTSPNGGGLPVISTPTFDIATIITNSFPGTTPTTLNTTSSPKIHTISVDGVYDFNFDADGALTQTLPTNFTWGINFFLRIGAEIIPLAPYTDQSDYGQPSVQFFMVSPGGSGSKTVTIPYSIGAIGSRSLVAGQEISLYGEIKCAENSQSGSFTFQVNRMHWKIKKA